MIVSRRFGSESWAQLYRDIAGSHACFRRLVTPDTLIPLTAYLALHDELIRRFFAEDERSHIELGRESARWALRDGPYKSFIEERNFASFVASFPKLWNLYFAETTSFSEASVRDDAVEMSASDLPEWHPYLEHFVIGYQTEMLEMICANPMTATRIRGGSGTRYAYLVHPSALDGDGLAVAPHRRPSSDERTRRLSDREMDVLRLVAEGKTNLEIGAILGISAKTAQHHVANSYRKVGVANRVGAAMWLAERGFIGRSG